TAVTFLRHAMACLMDSTQILAQNILRKQAMSDIGSTQRNLTWRFCIIPGEKTSLEELMGSSILKKCSLIHPCLRNLVLLRKKSNTSHKTRGRNSELSTINHTLTSSPTSINLSALVLTIGIVHHLRIFTKKMV